MHDLVRDHQRSTSQVVVGQRTTEATVLPAAMLDTTLPPKAGSLDPKCPTLITLTFNRVPRAVSRRLWVNRLNGGASRALSLTLSLTRTQRISSLTLPLNTPFHCTPHFRFRSHSRFLA